MANFNKVLLMGNLTRDPQLSYLPSQTAVVDFGLAVNRRWTGKDGQDRSEVCFVDCRAFGRQAETINKYLTKGRAVFVEGRLTLDSWTAQDGSKRNKHRVTVENFQFLPAAAAATDNAGQTAGDQQAETNDKQEAPPADDIPF
jgi:single-strand DNA-binding protein